MSILMALLMLAVAGLSLVTSYKLNQRIDNLHSQIETSCAIAEGMKDSAAIITRENAESQRLVARYSATVNDYSTRMDSYSERFKKMERELEKLKNCEYGTIVNYYAEQEGRI